MVLAGVLFSFNLKIAINLSWTSSLFYDKGNRSYRLL